MGLPRKILEDKLRSFLEEDVGLGDLTTLTTIPVDVTVKARIIAKEPGVIAGVEEVKVLLESLGLKVKQLVTDGSHVEAYTQIVEIEGDARAILTAERTALNILMRMSGIATETRKLVNLLRAAGYKTTVACTRKVAPGLLYFDKKAVTYGGGDTHRLHLDDLILIKDNHKILAGGISEAVSKARKASFTKKIEVEVTTLNEAVEAAKAGADIIMFDNMKASEIREAIEIIRGMDVGKRIITEASGKINEENILEYARTGVDIVTPGVITHSAKALDLSLEVFK
jgi:nicotinate-nucleotide pyrophosphorylase (carboxylating)